MEENTYTIENLILNINKYLEKADTSLVLKAYNYLSNYIIDTKEILETSIILTTVYADIETIVASLLYKLLTLELVTEKDLKDNSLVIQKGKKVFLKVIFE